MFIKEGVLVDVEHVNAHRTEKAMQQMSLLEKFITERNEEKQTRL